MLSCPAGFTVSNCALITLADALRQRNTNAQLKSWKVLRKIRCCPHRTTSLVKAVLVLIQAG